MKPVAIFRHVAIEGPGFLVEFLDAHSIPWQLIAIDVGEAVPQSAADFSGLVFMGGPMSVNDNLPWMLEVAALIRDAVARDIPVLGHCLGGQLMSSALGAIVSQNSVKEIGWGEVSVAKSEVARTWFGDISDFKAFHWHGETFSLPEGASLLLSSEYCSNQAWAIGKHLALQCHVEMTSDMVASWCEACAEEIGAAGASPAVQSASKIQQQAADDLTQLREAARQLYCRWVSGLK